MNIRSQPSLMLSNDSVKRMEWELGIGNRGKGKGKGKGKGTGKKIYS